MYAAAYNKNSFNSTDKHSTMLNLTARLAVDIRHLPDWEIDWDNNTPQRDPATLTINTFYQLKVMDRS